MYEKVVVILYVAALALAGYSGPPTYGYNPAVSSVSYKSQSGTFGPVASNAGIKPPSGHTVSSTPTPVPGVFTATTRQGNPVSIPSYPPVQYSTGKSNAVSYAYTTPTAAYSTQYSGVTDYPASYSPQNYAQYPQGYSQTYPQTNVYQAYPQAYSQAYPQEHQLYANTGQVVLSGHQAYPVPSQYQAYPVPSQYQAYPAPSQYQAYPAPSQYQAYPAPTQHQAYSAPSQYQANPAPTQHQAYSAPSQYQAYPAPTQQQAYQAPVQYQTYSVPAQYPGYHSGYPGVQYSQAPVQYSPAPAVTHVQYSGSDGSYSWKKK